MAATGKLLSSIYRQLVVGDTIHHPTLGAGKLIAGWEGYLEVKFSTETRTFTDTDGYRLIPANKNGEYQLLKLEEAREWSDEQAQHKDLALAEIRSAFQSDFINAKKLFRSNACRYLTHLEYEQELVSFVQRWMQQNSPSVDGKPTKVPDDEQALAIGSVIDHVQVVARAGSGKTETVANRAVFLQKHCGVAPSEMLLLAFNKDAAKELSERITSKLSGGALPHIMTFHALAVALVPGAKNLLVNQSDGADQSLNREFQQVLMDALENPNFEGRISRLMLAHFRADWDHIINGGFNLSREEMLKFRRSLTSETLRGEYVKSFGEKVIANFLFEHDVPYKYEQNHWWSGRNYRPDFTLPKCGSMPRGIVVEYFGMEGDPDYDEQTVAKRAYWETKSNEWILVELGPKYLAGGQSSLEKILAESLAAAKITVVRLSEDEIWQRSRPRSILRFTEAVSGFVGRCRKKWITPDMLKGQIAGHLFISEIEKWFVEIAVELYESYLERLKATQLEDFDGLLQQAVVLISEGSSKFCRKSGDGDLRNIRYLFVDEYQDFTELFHRMVAAIRKLNPHAALFCVGDNWQAINRFAGSDLKYYNQFKSFFDPASRLGISTNRRSTQQVVDVSNALMKGRGDPAVSSSLDKGGVAIVDLAKFKPTSLEEQLFNRSLLTLVILRLAGKALGEGKSVVLLSSKNNLIDPSAGNMSIDRYLKFLKSKLPVGLRDGLSISTTHRFKGNQSHVVIIMDALERSYPLIHPNWVFSRILGESEKEIINESRRLFYVALTRAKEDVFIITEEGRRSPFLAEISATTHINEIHWPLYPPVIDGDDWITVRVSGSYQSISPLINSLKADSYIYRDQSKNGGLRSWDRNFRVSELKDGFLVNSPWVAYAHEHNLSGVIVNFFDGMDRCFMNIKVQNGSLLLPASLGSQAFSLTIMKAALSPPASENEEVVEQE